MYKILFPDIFRRRAYNVSTLAMSLLIGLLVLNAVAQVYTETVIDDIRGVPSSVAVHQAERQAQAARNAAAAKRHQRDEHLAAVRRQHRAWLASLGSRPHSKPVINKTVVAPIPKKPTTVAVNGSGGSSTKHPNPAPTIPPAPASVVEVALQDVTFTFLTPQREPAARVPIVAVIHREGQTDQDLTGLATDERGRVTLSRVGPPPCTVELAIPNEESQTQNIVPGTDSNPGWQVADVQTASIDLPTARGHRIGVNAAAPGPYARIASSRPRFAAAPPGSNSVPRSRTVLWAWEAPDPILVERTVTDLAVVAPAGSRVTTPALPDRTLIVPSGGRLVCRLPIAALTGGPLPLRIAQDLPGGEAEALIPGDYPVDPYATAIPERAASLRLVRLSSVKTADGLGVWRSMRKDVVLAMGGEPAPTSGRGKRKKEGVGVATDSGDGASWWDFSTSKGVCVKLRHTPSGEETVERLRLTSPSGGTVSGLVAGNSTQADVERALGPADAINARTPGDFPRPDGPDIQVTSYLEGGLQVATERSGTVRWIELARPTELLEGGTTAFVPRSAARLYVAPFTGGDPQTQMPDATALRRYLARLPSVRLVDMPEGADLALTATGATFKDQRDSFLIKNLPFRYACETRLTYRLADIQTGQDVAPERTVSVSAKADYTAEAAGGAALVAILAHQKSGLARLAAGLIGIGGIAELQRAVGRAVNRCPALSARAAFAQIAQDVGRAGGYSARITRVDYRTGRLWVNAGTRQGVRVSTPDAPCEFEVLVNGTALPGSESGLSADYWTAVVRQADAESAECELRHVKRKVERTREKSSESLDLDMVRRLPDATTGLVSVRSLVRFPSLPLVEESGATEADLQGALVPAQSEPVVRTQAASDSEQSRRRLLTCYRQFRFVPPSLVPRVEAASTSDSRQTNPLVPSLPIPFLRMTSGKVLEFKGAPPCDRRERPGTGAPRGWA